MNIKTNKKYLIERCEQRGYNIEDVMSCVIEMNGDLWTIDTNHPAYPLPKNNSTKTTKKNIQIGGVGTEIKKLLSYIGIKSTPTCTCNARAKMLDEKGIQWCKENKETIVSWLEEEAKKRKLPFMKIAGRKLIDMAIKRAENNKCQ